MRFAALIALCLMSASPPPALAQSAPAASAESRTTPTALRMALTGRWKGTLGYRDYQSNTLYELPVTTTITAIRH